VNFLYLILEHLYIILMLPIALLLSKLYILFLAVFGRRITEGETINNRLIKEGQRWELKEDIHEELRRGIHVVKQYCGDRILLLREDYRHDLPQGCSPTFDIDIMDNPNFELITERGK